MAIEFDRIVLAVPELSAASAQYQQLFGVPPFNCHTPGVSRLPGGDCPIP